MLCASLIFAGSAAGAFVGSPSRMQQSRVGYDAAASSARVAAAPEMKLMDLTGKTAFVAGVADSSGYGWAICKALAEAGATITVGTWPPVLGIFEKSLNTGTPLALFFYVYISSPFRSLRLPAFSREAVPRSSGGGGSQAVGFASAPSEQAQRRPSVPQERGFPIRRGVSQPRTTQQPQGILKEDQ